MIGGGLGSVTVSFRSSDRISRPTASVTANDANVPISSGITTRAAITNLRTIGENNPAAATTEPRSTTSSRHGRSGRPRLDIQNVESSDSSSDEDNEDNDVIEIPTSYTTITRNINGRAAKRRHLND